MSDGNKYSNDLFKNKLVIMLIAYEKMESLVRFKAFRKDLVDALVGFKDLQKLFYSGKYASGFPLKLFREQYGFIEAIIKTDLGLGAKVAEDEEPVVIRRLESNYTYLLEWSDTMKTIISTYKEFCEKNSQKVDFYELYTPMLLKSKELLIKFNKIIEGYTYGLKDCASLIETNLMYGIDSFPKLFRLIEEMIKIMDEIDVSFTDFKELFAKYKISLSTFIKTKQGGGSEVYLKKYLKYKNKYLQLQNL